MLGDLLRAFSHVPTGTTETYSIRLPIKESFAARSPSGKAALLMPISGDPTAPGRSFEGIALDFKPRVRFEIADRTWEGPVAVLECVDESLLQTFCVLCEDMATRIGVVEGLPTPRVVLDALWEWENLLRRHSRLSSDAELGLWGELWFLLSLPHVDAGIGAWRGPEGFAADFYTDNIGIECKVSKTRLRHFVSHDQVAAERSFSVFVLSMWVAADPAGGRSLSELVAEIDDRVTDAMTWERLLLKAGYRRSATSEYTTRYGLLEAPLVFPDLEVPRVRAADPGVRQLRYCVELDSAKAITSDEWRNLVSKFTAG
jgi:hypothetical protein